MTPNEFPKTHDTDPEYVQGRCPNCGADTWFNTRRHWSFICHRCESASLTREDIRGNAFAITLVIAGLAVAACVAYVLAAAWLK